MSKLQEVSFEIIASAGDAKSLAYEALNAAKNNDRITYELKINEAEEKINEAHKLQYKLLTAEANGEIKNEGFSIIVVHAQDHLMTCLSTIEVFKELSELYLKINIK